MKIKLDNTMYCKCEAPCLAHSNTMAIFYIFIILNTSLFKGERMTHLHSRIGKKDKAEGGRWGRGD